MGSMLFPLQLSWAANSSAVSWSCVGEVAAGCSSLQSKLQTVRKDRDILLQEVNSLTSTMNILRKEYQASNLSFEEQIQYFEKEKLSQEVFQTNLREKVEQLEDQRDSNTRLLREQRDEIERRHSQIRSLEEEKNYLETIQINLREKVEQLEEQQEFNAKLLREQRNEIQQLPERAKPLSSSSSKVAPSDSLSRKSNIQYFQYIAYYWVGYIFFLGILLILVVAFRSNDDAELTPLGESLIALSCWWWLNDFVFISALLLCSHFCYGRLRTSHYIGILVVEIIFLILRLLVNYYWIF